jgi:hypothetical protein
MEIMFSIRSQNAPDRYNRRVGFVERGMNEKA